MIFFTWSLITKYHILLLSVLMCCCIMNIFAYCEEPPTDVTAVDDSVILEFVAWYDSLLSNKEWCSRSHYGSAKNHRQVTFAPHWSPYSWILVGLTTSILSEYIANNSERGFVYTYVFQLSCGYYWQTMSSNKKVISTKIPLAYLNLRIRYELNLSFVR